MKFRSALPCLIALALLTAAVHSQPLGTDIFTGHTSGRIVRTTPAGVSTTLGNFGYFINMLTMDTDNKTIVALDSLSGANPQKVIRIDPLTMTIVNTVFGGPPFTTVQSWLEVDQDGDYIVADKTMLFKVFRNGSGLNTLYNDPNGYFFSFTEDKTTGDWLIGDYSARHIARLDRHTMTLKTVIPIGAPPTGMMPDPQQEEIIISGGSTTFLSYHPVTHVVATIVTGAGSANASTVDRAPDGTGALLYAGTTGGQIIKFDRKGTNLGVFGSTGAGSCLGVAFDRSRNLGPELITAPNDRIIRLSFPGDAGKSYVFALSLSGCKPGVTLLDGRVIALNPDNLTVATSQFPIPPLLSGNIGVLDPFDEAIVTLNLNSLGNVVKGLRLYGVAIVIDPNAAMGISQISSPLLFVL